MGAMYLCSAGLILVRGCAVSPFPLPGRPGVGTLAYNIGELDCTSTIPRLGLTFGASLRMPLNERF